MKGGGKKERRKIDETRKEGIKERRKERCTHNRFALKILNLVAGKVPLRRGVCCGRSL